MAKPPRPPAASTSSSTTALPPRPPPKTPIDYEAELRSPWYRSFRSKYLAVGVAIIAASGSLFGAQLKTTWQSYQASKTRALAEGSSPEESSTEKKGAATGAGAEKDAAAAAAATTKKVAGEEVSLQDLDRSISTLQSLRGQLVQRRMQEEMRLEKLRERVVERREAEARRTQVAGPGR